MKTYHWAYLIFGLVLGTVISLIGAYHDRNNPDLLFWLAISLIANWICAGVVIAFGIWFEGYLLRKS